MEQIENRMVVDSEWDGDNEEDDENEELCNADDEYQRWRDDGGKFYYE